MSVVSKKIGKREGYSEASGRYDSVYYQKIEKNRKLLQSLERHVLYIISPKQRKGTAKRKVKEA